MLENITQVLESEEKALLKRLEQGMELITQTPEGDLCNSYRRHYNELKNSTLRVQTCLDILNGGNIVIAELAGELVIADRTSKKTNALVKEAQRLGAYITSVEELR